MKDARGAESVDAYVAAFPRNVQAILRKVRQTIRTAAPEAQEKMGYGIPTFVLEGNLVHFAAFKSHLGFYPGPSGIERFAKELAKYEGAKGSVRFPLDRPIPHRLIARIVKFRVRENLAKAAEKKAKKK